MSERPWPPPFPVDPALYDDPLDLFARLLVWAEEPEEPEEESEEEPDD